MSRYPRWTTVVAPNYITSCWHKSAPKLVRVLLLNRAVTFREPDVERVSLANCEFSAL